MSWCLMGKVKLLTNLPPLPFHPDIPRLSALSAKKKKSHCVIELMSGGHCTPQSNLTSFVQQLITVTVAGTYGPIIIRPHGRIFPATIILWEVTGNVLKCQQAFLSLSLLVLQSDQRRADRVCWLFLTTFLLYRYTAERGEGYEREGGRKSGFFSAAS